MNRFFRIKESSNYERLRNSLEFRCLRRSAMAIWIFTAAMLLLAALVGIGKTGRSMASFVILIVVFFPLNLYYVYRFAVLFSDIDHWTFTQVKLDRPHIGGRGGAYFTVTVRDRSGRELERDTGVLFGEIWEPRFEDSNNKMALVGYNDETDTVALIKILP